MSNITKLTGEELLELIAYHHAAVMAACRGGHIGEVEHEKIRLHGAEYHRLAIVAEARGIYRRPSA